MLPVSLWYVPAAHAVHDDEPALAAKLPALQLAQSAANDAPAEGKYFPLPQLVHVVEAEAVWY